MPKQPRRTKRPEILNRTLEITSFGTRVRVGVDEPKDPEPEIEAKPWLELRGVSGSFASLPPAGVTPGSHNGDAFQPLLLRVAARESPASCHSQIRHRLVAR